jgi:DNA-directed RNA polymerase specialized sigma24 family protein
MKGGARQGSGRKPINIDERRAFTLYEQGFTKLEIAKRFGVPYNSLRTIFRKAGKFMKRKSDE